jgi:hypothetical protein
VIEGSLSKSMMWLQEYLEADRGIHLIWSDNNTLHASAATKSALSFLWTA